jgi:predicted anti-sigma-YlaC factor YlaD
MECREVREFLPAYDDLGGALQLAAIDSHLAGCAGCRVVLEQYRALAGGLAALAQRPVESPPWLLGTLTDAVGEQVARQAAMRARRERLTDPRVLAAGGAVLTAAGLVGAMVARQRRQRRRRNSFRRVLARAW